MGKFGMRLWILAALVATPVVSARAQSLITLYSFTGAADGGGPTAALTKVGNSLFGTTANASLPYNLGTVFRINPMSGAETAVHSFSGGSDGNYPYAGLLKVGPALYGTTTLGGGTGCGGSGCGTIFRYDIKTQIVTILYSFEGANDGAAPTANLINVAGVLYGVTGNGGGTGCFMGNGCGTVFSYTIANGAYAILHTFNGSDGSNPSAAMLDVGGSLYGVTYRGGAGTGCVEGYGCGTAFKFVPATGTLTVLHSFSSSGGDGASPQAPLINVNGALYGTTNLDGTGGCGGPYGCGAIFKMNRNTGAVTPLHEFTGGSDGNHPVAGMLNVNGTLYGTTQGGGITTSACSMGCGTVFSVDPTTGAENVVYAFTGGGDGAHPNSALISVGSVLYSTTNGGALGFGTVFRLTLAP